MIVKPDGPLCRCGNRGCLETFCGSSYLIERARFGIRNGRKTSLKEPITPKTIETEARRGDSLSLSIVNEMGYYLGIGITSIYAVLDPDRIVIAGGMAPMTDLLIKFITPVTKRIYTKRDIDVRRSELGDDAGILGASLCVIQS
jgi:glucokinase